MDAFGVCNRASLLTFKISLVHVHLRMHIERDWMEEADNSAKVGVWMVAEADEQSLTGDSEVEVAAVLHAQLEQLSCYSCPAGCAPAGNCYLISTQARH